MYEDVKQRLEFLGYTFDETADKWAVEVGIVKVTDTIKNECNITAIPDGLNTIAVDMVCGEFLSLKKASGQLDGFNVDFNAAALKQVQEGDTNVGFSLDGLRTPEQRLDAVIKYLMGYGKSQFVTYRRFKWT